MPEPMRQQLVAEQAGKIADLLGVKIEDIRFDSNGVKLDHEQMGLLFTALIGRGFKNAAATLREEAERVNAPGPDHNLDLWAIYLAGASFLDGQVNLAKKYEVCRCRCTEGRHCGGCGHDGCGYRAEIGG